MLANLMFFWDETDWVPTTEPAVIVTNTTIGGKPEKHQYHGRDEDFWEVRERYLRRFLPEEVLKPEKQPVSEEIVAHKPIDKTIILKQAQDAAVIAARNAKDYSALRETVLRILQIVAEIADIKKSYDFRARFILLSDLI